MFSHIVVGSNDLDQSKLFYDAAFGALGGEPGMANRPGRLFYTHNGGALVIATPLDGEPATHGNGATIGITMDAPEQVDAWHEAGVANGGTSVEDPPGRRDSAMGPLYLAYLRDPDGNKLCAFHKMDA